MSERDWDYYLVSSFPRLARIALETNNIDLINGIQALDVSIWTHPRGCESLLNFMGARYKRNELPVRYSLINQSLRGVKWFPFYCELNKDGFLSEYYSRRETEYNDDGELITTERVIELSQEYDVFHRDPDSRDTIYIDREETSVMTNLSEVWRAPLERAERNDQDPEMFISAFGKFLGLGYLQKGIKNNILRIFRLINIANEDGSINRSEYERIFEGVELRKVYDMEGRDEKKNPDSRLYAVLTRDKVILNRPVILTYQQLQTLALDLYRGRDDELG